MAQEIENLCQQIKSCQICKGQLPLEIKPIFQLSKQAKILIVGQAPGEKTHDKGTAFDDLSGDRLREWLGVDRQTFYYSGLFAILPMGLCYPGKKLTKQGKVSGDLPPRPECAPHWHPKVLPQLSHIQLTLLIGQYAQKAYLAAKPRAQETKTPLTLTENVRQWRLHAPKVFPLPHPSPRNRFWMSKNPWFEEDLLPELKQSIQSIIQVSS